MPTAFRDKGAKWDAGTVRSQESCPYGSPQDPAQAGALLHPSVPSAGLGGRGLRSLGISISVKSRKQCPVCGEMKVGTEWRGGLKSEKGGARESERQMGGDKAR